MKRSIKAQLILMLVAGLFVSACEAERESSDESDISSDGELYFGQKPVGSTPEDLNPEAFSTAGWQLGTDFTPDTDEFYFTTSGGSPFSPTVVVFRKENRAWRQYKFQATGSDTLYSRDKYIERTESGWSAIKSLGAPFEDIRIMRLTASLDGTLVFDEVGNNGDGVLRYSRLVNGKREAPKPLGKEINTGTWTAHPFIAYDGFYIIWDSEREGGYGDSDMYISFLQPDGSWGPAINFGEEINTDGEDGGGYVTPDGKFLSYCPRCDPPYDRKWVDAQIIETLRSQNSH